MDKLIIFLFCGERKVFFCNCNKILCRNLKKAGKTDKKDVK